MCVHFPQATTPSGLNERYSHWPLKGYRQASVWGAATVLENGGLSFSLSSWRMGANRLVDFGEPQCVGEFGVGLQKKETAYTVGATSTMVAVLFRFCFHNSPRAGPVLANRSKARPQRS